MILTTADHQPPFFPVNIYQDVTRNSQHSLPSPFFPYFLIP